MPLVPHGFPDWYRLSGRADEIFLLENNNNIDVQIIHGPFFVGAHQALQLRIEAVINNFLVVLRYFDQPGGSQLGIQAVTVRSGSVFASGMPVIGPYVQFEITPNLGNGWATYSLWSAQAASHTMEDTQWTNLLVGASNVAIGAGANRADNPLRVWYGEATWSVKTNAVNWASIIQALDHQGNTRIVDNIGPASHEQRRTVFLPASNIRITTTNFDAADKQFWISLSARPIWLGS